MHQARFLVVLLSQAALPRRVGFVHFSFCVSSRSSGNSGSRKDSLSKVNGRKTCGGIGRARKLRAKEAIMNRIRRPWGPTRRDTDGVQMNTLDHSGKMTAEDEERGSAAEKLGFEESTMPVDHGEGHLQEIEVDVAHVLKDREVKDIEEDTSPYPEVRAVVPETDDPDIPVNTLRMWILGE